MITSPLIAHGSLTLTIGDEEPTVVATLEFPVAVVTSDPFEGNGVTVDVDIQGQLAAALRSLAAGLVKDNPKTVLRGDAAELNPRDEATTAFIAINKQRRKELTRSEFRDGPAHVVYGDRQSGKTYLAIQWLLDAPADVERHLIVHDHRLAVDLQRDSGSLNIHGQRSFDVAAAALRAKRAGKQIEIGVDDANILLAGFLHLPQIDLVTITTDEPRSILVHDAKGLTSPSTSA